MRNKRTKQLSYRTIGSGSPVLFLHGFMENSSMWNNVLPISGIEAILIDLNGHGDSLFAIDPKPSITFLAHQVMDLVKEKQWFHAPIVGHSLGGYVGLSLMELNPYFEHLTLFHSHPWADSDAKKKDRDRVVELVKQHADFFIREAIPNLFYQPEKHTTTISTYVDIAKKMNSAAIAWSSKAMRDREDFQELMCKHPTKFTCIQGEMDKLIPKQQLMQFCNENHINYLEIPACGHMGQEESSETVHELLTLILSEHRETKQLEK